MSIYYSCDSHVVEPPEVFEGLEGRFGERAPKVLRNERGDRTAVTLGGIPIPMDADMAEVPAERLFHLMPGGRGERLPRICSLHQASDGRVAHLLDAFSATRRWVGPRLRPVPRFKCRRAAPSA